MVIYFGRTTHDCRGQSYIVLTCYYHVPNVMLGLGWSYPCDVWSVDCILVELCLVDWTQSATSRSSFEVVSKLPRLQNLIMEHADHPAGGCIHLLPGLLKHDPFDRLTARESLKHPFFTKDNYQR